MSEPIHTALSARFDEDLFLVREEDRRPYELDWRGRYVTSAVAVLRPKTPGDVQAMVRFCQAHGLGMVPQGGNTGLVGGSVPTPTIKRPQVIISLSRLKTLRNIDPINNTVTTEAGVTLFELQDAVRRQDRLFPLSLASEGSCEIGGNIATNAGGIQVLRYGSMRALVLGLEVVLPNGELWVGLRGLRKDNTGYDLKQCFIGSEGTLGIITAATLKIFPVPPLQTTLWVSLESAATALALFHRLQDLALEISAFELIGRAPLELCLRHIPNSRDPLEGADPWAVLIQVDRGVEAVMAIFEKPEIFELVEDAVIAQNAREARELWALRENLSEAQRIEGVSLKHDISLPLSEIPHFIEAAEAALKTAAPGVRVMCFGHLGDGNLHFNLFPPGQYASADALESGPGQTLTPIVLDLVAALGGSFSAEHGVGQFKVNTLQHYRDPIEVGLMRQLKDAWDPHHLMNPGKLFPHE